MAPMFEDCAVQWVRIRSVSVMDWGVYTLPGFWWVTGQDGQGCFWQPKIRHKYMIFGLISFRMLWAVDQVKIKYS